MRVLVTGNPNKDSLAKGIKNSLDGYDVTFVSQSNGWSYTDQSTIADHCIDYDIFINCSKYFQLNTLDTVYRTWDSINKSSLIINVGSTSTFWNMTPVSRVWQEKRVLEEKSKQLSYRYVIGESVVRSTYIAFGRLGKQEWRDQGVKGIDLDIAGGVIKNIIDLPVTYNMQYISMDAYD